jgi:hypothetical protein
MKMRHEIDEAPILLGKTKKIAATVAVVAVMAAGVASTAASAGAAGSHSSDRKMLHDAYVI